MTQQQASIAPHDTDAEMSVLGAVFCDNNILDELDFLKVSDFYNPAHQEIYRAILDMRSESKVVNLASLAGYLRDRGKLEEIGGPVYLAGLNNIPTGSIGRQSAERVVKLSNNRKVWQCCVAAYNDIMQPGADPEKVLLQFDDVKSTIRHVGYDDHLTMRHARACAEIYRQHINTGSFARLEIEPKVFVNLIPGYYLVSACSSHGKTAWMLSRALDFAMAGIPVDFYSMELPVEQIYIRLVCMLSGKPSTVVATKKTTKQWLDKISEAEAYLDTLPLNVIGGYTDPNNGKSVPGKKYPHEIKGITKKRMKRLGQKVVVFIDQFSHVLYDKRDKLKGYEWISTQIESMWKELKTAVFVGQQMQRKAGMRIDAELDPSSCLRYCAQTHDDCCVHFTLDRPSADRNRMELIRERKIIKGVPAENKYRDRWSSTVIRKGKIDVRIYFDERYVVRCLIDKDRNAIFPVNLAWYGIAPGGKYQLQEKTEPQESEDAETDNNNTPS
jgi:replicative DNA helicase